VNPNRDTHWNNPARRLTPRLLGIGALICLLMHGCSVPPPQTKPTPKTTPTSLAPNAKNYRLDAAKHVYAQQADRVFKGRLPPMLHAIGVLNIDIDHQGQIQALQWTRAPHHAPEVMREIERMVHAAAPFPAPTRLGKVTYTDVWLWDKSGLFQLDTLTEGQD
jgi:protein TonB